jgi:hypothetical protein
MQSNGRSSLALVDYLWLEKRFITLSREKQLGEFNQIRNSFPMKYIFQAA